MSERTADPVDVRSESLSELLARILNQLALSAWLPSAALTFLMWFVLQLGSIVETQRTSSSGEAVSMTFQSLSHTGLGGVVLAVGMVVVLTLLTQAFSFEAIRVLEGYWGTSARVERLAAGRRMRHLDRRQRLARLQTHLTKQAWKSAANNIGHINAGLASRGQGTPMTPQVVRGLRARVLGGRTVTLTESERSTVLDTDWKSLADPELIRRRVSVIKSLEDFPSPAHVLPTRLGNVLRHFEDKTGYEEVESLVDDAWDVLPFNLKLRHDELRGRLDVYSSMVFVTVIVGIACVLRFLPAHVDYALWGAAIAAVSSVFCYRAAVASARAYGPVLVSIASHRRRTSAATQLPSG